jgi:hypothetical protein
MRETGELENDILFCMEAKEKTAIYPVALSRAIPWIEP